MACPQAYDLQLTDADGTAHGFICDWSKGGAGLTVEKASNLENSRVSTKGDYGVRDVTDFDRIIQTDWSEGEGQTTYDRDIDSASAYYKSKRVYVGEVGELRIGPQVTETTDLVRDDDCTTLPAIIAHGDDGDLPLVYGAFTNVTDELKRIRYSSDGVSWTDISTAGPDDNATAMCSDGQYIYAACGGVVYQGDATGFQSSVGADNTGITHVAFASGYLYAAKGAVGTTAQVGTFDNGTWDSTTGTANWTEMTPPDGTAINAAGETFGLVSSGNYVYWGVTNNVITKVYKLMYSSIADNVLFQEVCVFPTGFVGRSMYAYLGTIYVGGGFVTDDTDTGIGAIYAIINDQPALLTDVGTRSEEDNHVRAMTAYARSLYFVANADIWRWDLVRGGYSHHAGPLNSNEVIDYDTITWGLDWSCDVVPGTGAEEDATLSTLGASSVSFGNAQMLITLSENGGAWRKYTTTNSQTSMNNAIGTTMEVDIPDPLATEAEFLSGVHDTGFVMSIQDGTLAALVEMQRSRTSNLVTVKLMSGTNHVSSSTVATASFNDVTYGGSTIRFTLKGTIAKVFLDDALLCSGTISTATTDKSVYIQAYRLISGAADDDVSIKEVRMSDDGAYEPGAYTTVTGVGIAALGDKIVAACSGYGHSVSSSVLASPTTYCDNDSGYVMSSLSSGNMPTVDKYFHAVHVNVASGVPENCTVTCAVEVDGAISMLTEDTDQGDDNLLVFPIGVVGRRIRYVLFVTSSDGLRTVIPTEVAILFRPVPKTTRLYSYYLRVWDRVESRVNGQMWDEDAETCCDFIEEVANTTVTVDRPTGASYTGYIESLQFVEAPPSARSSGRQGIYKLDIRRLS